MSLLDNVINDDSLTDTMKSVYKYINKHSEQINTVLDLVYNDVSKMFKDVNKDGDMIIINTKNDDTIISSVDTITDIMATHFNKVMNDASFGMTYVYKVYCIGPTIYITNKFNEKIEG